MNGEEAPRSDRGGRRRDAQRRGQNGRPRWGDSSPMDDFGGPFEPQEVDWIAQNGHPEAAPSIGAVSTDDDASLERHTLKLATEVAKMQEELEHYRKILAERSEVRRLKAELAASVEAAGKAREFHEATVATLQDKIGELEREGERMRTRILGFLDASKGTESQLQEQARALVASAAKARQLEAAGSEQGGKIQALSARLRDAEAWNEQLKAEKLATARSLQSAANALAAKAAEAEELRAQLLQARAEGQPARGSDLEAVVQRQAGDIAHLQGQLRGMQQAAAPRPPQQAAESSGRRPDAQSGRKAEPHPGPLLEEPALVELIASLLPREPGRPIFMGQLVRELNKRLSPQEWDRDYVPIHGMLSAFVARHPHRFSRSNSSHSGHLQVCNVGPPPPAEQPGAPGKPPGAPVEQPLLPPPGARFVVTPQLPEVLARRAAQRGSGAAAAGQQAERPGEASAAGAGNAQVRPAQQSPRARAPQQAAAAAAAAPPGMHKEVGAAGQQSAKSAQGGKASQAQQQEPPGLGGSLSSTDKSAGSSAAAEDKSPKANGEAAHAGQGKRAGGGGGRKRNNKRGGANRQQQADGGKQQQHHPVAA